MLKQLSTIAAVLFGLAGMQGAITPVLSPKAGDEVTNLASITVTFDGAEFISKPTGAAAMANATLTNETTGKKYVCTKINQSFSTANAATLLFGAEGTTTQLGEITEDGTYTLSITAGYFKSYDQADVYPDGYTSPVIEATYTIGGETKDEMSDYILTPAAGDVTEIGTIKVDFPETGLMGINIASTSGITLTYTSGMTTRVAKVVKSQFSYGTDCVLMFDWEDATIKEPMTFTAPGTYTLDIPAESFTDWSGKLKNRAITAIFNIAANGGAMSRYSLRPTPGVVSELSTIELSFGGNEVNTLQLADDLSGITITRKGDLKTVWHCINGVKTSTDSYVRLTFAREGSDEAATIDAPGEYLLNVPAGMISGFTTDNRKWNDPIQALYVIETGANHMGEYTILPDGETLKELLNVEITFPYALDGLDNPVDTSGITMTFTSYSDDTMTYKPNGCQINGNSVTLVFGNSGHEPFTTPGKYLLTIPEGTFKEYLNKDSYSPLIEREFSIDIADGVEEIATSVSSSPVYNLQGIMVRRPGETRQLPAGIYIIGGSKVRVAR